jgi:hypothetical protein
MSSPPEALSPVNPQKLRTGVSRVWHAAGYSLAGLRAGWGETAFRQEAWLALVLLPLAFWIGRSWVEVALLAGSVLLVMIVELLNTGIEAGRPHRPRMARPVQARQGHGQRRGAAGAAAGPGHLDRRHRGKVRGMSAPPFSICVYCGSRNGVDEPFVQRRAKSAGGSASAAASWSTAAATTA